MDLNLSMDQIIKQLEKHPNAKVWTDYLGLTIREEGKYWREAGLDPKMVDTTALLSVARWVGTYYHAPMEFRPVLVFSERIVHTRSWAIAMAMSEVDFPRNAKRPECDKSCCDPSARDDKAS